MSPFRMLGQNDVARADEAGLLAWGQGTGGCRERGAGFHLDKGEQTGFLGHRVYLAGSGAQAAGQDRPSIVA